MEIPMTPTRSRQDWIRDWWVEEVGERLRWFRSHEPLHQKQSRYAVKPTAWNTQASRRRPFPLPVYSYPAAEIVEWISRNGIAIIRKKRSNVTVMWSATPRATRLIVFEMSHSISSASTAARAIVDENASADRRLKLSLSGCLLKLFAAEWCSWLLSAPSPERIGKIFWSTTVETKRKVTKNGIEEKAMAVGPCAPRPGLHSSQLAEFIEAGDSCCIGVWAFARHQVLDSSILWLFLSFSNACRSHQSWKLCLLKWQSSHEQSLQIERHREIGLVS